MLVYFLFAFLPLLVQGIVQNCNQLKIEYYYDSFNYGETDFTAIITLTKNDLTGLNKVVISNYSYNDTSPKPVYPSQYCIDADLTHCSTPQYDLIYETSDPSISLYARLGGSWSYLYYGYIDDGSFSAPNGTLYTPQNPSYSTFDFNLHRSISESQTCISFVPAPAVTNPYPQRCKKFTTKTSVFNTTQNNALFLSTTMKFTMYPGHFILNGTVNIPVGTVFRYGMNSVDEECSSDFGYNCYFDIRGNSEKLIFYGIFGKRNSTSWKDLGYVPMIGRMILRNGQTLRKEGAPFTPSNNCEYYESDFADNQIAKSQLCCTEFGL